MLATGFPEVDANSLLTAVWVDAPPEDKERLSPTFKPLTGYPSRNGIVKNLNRKKLAETWLGKKYRFGGPVKIYNRETGLLELAEQKSELARTRLLVQLSVASRSDSELVAQLLAKGATVSLFGRLDAMEEPEWPARHITIEFTQAEPVR